MRIAETLSRRWWLILLLSSVGIGCAYYLSTHAATRYQSTVSLQLNPAARSSFLPYLADNGGGSTNPVVSQAASYREVLRSTTFGQVIVQQLNLPLPPETIAAAITTQLVPNTNILHLSVTWDNPSDAQQLAQRIAELFIAENQRRQQSQPGIQAQLADMEQSARDIQARLGPLQQQRDRLDESVARGDLSRLNELTGLDGRLSALESSYASLLVEISRVRGSFDTAVILDNATPALPLDAMPLVQALLFGVLGGAAVAIGLVLFLERLADPVRVPPDVAASAPLPIVGRIAHARRSSWKLRRGQPSGALVMLEPRSPPAAEGFRSLRATLQLADLAEPLRTVVICSAGSHEGKTFVASNLAIALAQGGKRVLLVDANLRRPAIHRWFGVANSTGFSDALGQAPLWSQDDGEIDVPGVIASRIDRLWLLPSGTPPSNPAELMASDSLGWVFEQLSRRWDIVVIDTEPIGPVADTLLLAHQASGSIVVARSGRTRRATLRGAVAALRSVGKPIVGVVLDDEQPGPLARFGHDDYLRYSYSREDRPGELENSTIGVANGHIQAY
jgi:succinoglycan biosynthesis transport protein ExoP